MLLRLLENFEDIIAEGMTCTTDKSFNRSNVFYVSSKRGHYWEPTGSKYQIEFVEFTTEIAGYLSHPVC